MPLYDYTCPDGHEFERKAGFDDEWVECGVEFTDLCECCEVKCQKMAHRVQVYYDQSVHFHGPGFTRVATTPTPPRPPTTAKLNTTDALEVQNDFVVADYAHGEEYREQAKEDASKIRPEAID